MIQTGIKGLDSVVTGLQLGDNVVWQIDSIEDYAYFVTPFVRKALEDKRKLVYIRFASHKSLWKNEMELSSINWIPRQVLRLFQPG